VPLKKPNGPVAGKVQILRHEPQEDKVTAATADDIPPVTPSTHVVTVEGTADGPEEQQNQPQEQDASIGMTAKADEKRGLDPPASSSASPAPMTPRAIPTMVLTRSSSVSSSQDGDTWTRGQKLPAAGRRDGDGNKPPTPKAFIPRRPRPTPADDPEAGKRREARRKERAERGPRTKGILYKRLPDGKIVNADWPSEGGGEGGKENARHWESRQTNGHQAEWSSNGAAGDNSHRPATRKGDRFHLDAQHRSKWEGDERPINRKGASHHEGHHKDVNSRRAQPAAAADHNNNKEGHEQHVPVVHVSISARKSV